jgi:hypothetical protein
VWHASFVNGAALRGVALALALLLLSGCSDDATNAGSNRSTTVASSEQPIGSDPSSTTASTHNGATPATVAEANGWRLVVTQPTRGSTIGPTARLCYEIAGTSREPEVTLETALLSPPAAESQSVRVAGSVGRGSAELDFGLQKPGSYDLRVQLLVSGTPIRGVVVTVPNVTLSGTDAQPPC